MRLVFLGSAGSWYLSDLRRAAAWRGWVIDQAEFGQLSCTMDRYQVQIFSGQQALHEADAVLVRTMPPGTLEQVVFRMDLLARLEATGTKVVNPPRALEAAVDKFLCSARLHAAGLLTPRTIVCQTAEAALAAFERLGGDVVVKPLFGAEGRGIARLSDPALADRAFTMLERLGAVLYVQEFVPHDGYDLRLFVVGQRVLGMRRVNPHDWRTNISRGATGEPLEVTAELAAMALRAARAVGASLAGVDLLPGRDGQLYALEVNAVPGWRALSRTLEIDVADLVLEHVAAEVPGSRP